MSKVLVIKAHPHTDDSLSLTVGDEFIKKYQESHPTDEVIIRDLFDGEEVPPLNDVTFAAWKKEKNGMPLNDEEKDVLTRHNAWLDEFVNADKYIFINPMWNHFMPAQMKAYLDVTAVTHKTFKYAPDGSVIGLLPNKKVMHIQAAGGLYHANGFDDPAAKEDFSTEYLDYEMNFYGITDVDHIFIEGADAMPDKRQDILNAALKQADEKAEMF